MGKVTEEIDWQLIAKKIIEIIEKEESWHFAICDGVFWRLFAKFVEFWRRLPEEERRKILARSLEEFKEGLKQVKLEEIDDTKLREIVRELLKLHATRGTESSAQSSEAGGQV